MLEKLRRLLVEPAVEIDFSSFVFALGISLLAAYYATFLYQTFFGGKATGAQVHRSFHLLGPAITAVFLGVQFSLPLSLGLLGALSIIRFRTPIKEPEEVGFIMLLIASSVVCATFQFLMLFALLGTATASLLIQRHVTGRRGQRQDGLVSVALDGAEDGERHQLTEILQRNLRRARLQSVSVEASETIIHYSFANASLERVTALEEELRQLEHVTRVNVFLNRQGVLF